MSKCSIRMLTPDGFDMYNGKTYESKVLAWIDFSEWKKRFEIQGYYSSNKGRIDLSDLFNHMEIVED